MSINKNNNILYNEKFDSVLNSVEIENDSSK